jgi:membrane associated rhomboid family serine protease
MPSPDNVIKFEPKRPPPQPREPIVNVPTVVLAVVGTLIAIHALIWLMGDEGQVWMRYALSFNPVRLSRDVPFAAPQGAAVWSFLTYALAHQDVYHLGSNCIWLLIFSTPLSRRLGVGRYLIFLFFSAIAGAAAMLPLHWGTVIFVVGASACVSATLAAVIPIMFAPGFRMASGHTIDHQKLRVLRPRELLQNSGALAFAAVFLVMTLFTGATMAIAGTAFLEERSIAWEAHLGGFIAGLILFYLLDRKPVHTR